MTTEKGSTKINTIILTHSEGSVVRIRDILTGFYKDHFESLVQNALDDTIAWLKGKHEKTHIIFIDTKLTEDQLKNLTRLCPDAVYILCQDEDAELQKKVGALITLDFISLPIAGTQIPKILRRLEVSGKLPNVGIDHDEYVGVQMATILKSSPVMADVYIQIREGRYVRVFQKGDSVTPEDLQKYRTQKGVEQFYFKKSDCSSVMVEALERLEVAAAAKPLNEPDVEKLVLNSQDLVRDLITEIGFSDEAQKIAKASVNAVLKLIGMRPKLPTIWADLQAKEGSYITSHSIILAKLCCAMAHKVGWTSDSTYLKLTMSAFLHDIALNNEKLAMEGSIERAERSGRFSMNDLKEMKLHPAKAAEYARQFSEIPHEVEQIVSQHHERPDGTGFPRALAHQHLNPLASLFIVAHDMIEFSTQFPDTSMESFFKLKEHEYSQGIFRKIFLAVVKDVKMT